MLVRKETIYKTSYVLVIDELDKCLGEIYDLHFFKLCKNPQIIDEYEFYTVNKDKLLKYLK